MVNAPKKNISLHPEGKYDKSTKKSIHRRHQAKKARAAWWQNGSQHWEYSAACDLKRSLRQRKSRKHTFSRNEEKEKWIEHFVERETAVAGKWVQDTETAIMQDMTTAENGCATSGKPATRFAYMLNAIADSVSDLASSNDEQNGEDEEDDEEDTQLSKISDNDEPGGVMGTITNTVQRRIERFPQKQMRLDKLT
jgi:hypothetical protein